MKENPPFQTAPPPSLRSLNKVTSQSPFLHKTQQSLNWSRDFLQSLSRPEIHHHVYRIWTPTPVLSQMNLVYILLRHFNITFQFRSSSVLSVVRTELVIHFSSPPHVLNNPPTQSSLITSLSYHFVQLRVATGLLMQVSPLLHVTCFLFGPNALQVSCNFSYKDIHSSIK